MAWPHTDSFTDTNGVNIESHSHSGGSWDGPHVQFASDALEVQGNAVTRATGGGNTHYCDNTETISAGQYSKITAVAVVDTSQTAAPSVRAAASGFEGTITCYRAACVDDVVNLQWWSAGTNNFLDDDGGVGVNDGDVCYIEQNTSHDIVVKINGSDRITGNNDSSITSGFPGFGRFGSSTSHFMDDWEGGELSSGLSATLGPESIKLSDSLSSVREEYAALNVDRIGEPWTGRSVF